MTQQSRVATKIVILKYKRLMIKYFVVWAALLTIFLSVMSYYFLVQPQREVYFKKVEEEKRKIEDEIRLKEQQRDTLKESVKRYEILKDQEIEKIVGILPDVSERRKLFAIVTDMVADQGLHVKSFTMDEPVPIDRYYNEGLNLSTPVAVVSMRVEIEAENITYEMIKSLYAVLYNRYRIFSINSFNPSRLSDGDLKNISLQLEAFFQDKEVE